MSDEDRASSEHAPDISPAPSNEGNSAITSKVSEIFYTAGEAFNRLGEIVVCLKSVKVDPNHSRWSETEIECLKNALMRFSNDLEYVSKLLLIRSKKLVQKEIENQSLSPSTIVIDSSATSSSDINDTTSSSVVGISNASQTFFGSTANRESISRDIGPSSRIINEQQIEVPHVAETQTVAEVQDEPVSLLLDRPPVLIPAQKLPMRNELHVGSDSTYVRRVIPGTVVQSFRRLPVQIKNRPLGQSLRLISSAPNMTPVIRQRLAVTNDIATTSQPQSVNRPSRNIPYARVSTNSPQLVSASKTRLIPAKNVTGASNHDSSQINWGANQWRL